MKEKEIKIYIKKEREWEGVSKEDRNINEDREREGEKKVCERIREKAS